MMRFGLRERIRYENGANPPVRYCFRSIFFITIPFLESLEKSLQNLSANYQELPFNKESSSLLGGYSIQVYGTLELLEYPVMDDGYPSAATG